MLDMDKVYEEFGCELSLIADVCGTSFEEMLKIQMDTAEACEMPVCIMINQAFEQALESLGNPGTQESHSFCPNCGKRNTVFNENNDGSHCNDCGATWSYPED